MNAPLSRLATTLFAPLTLAAVLAACSSTSSTGTTPDSGSAADSGGSGTTTTVTVGANGGLTFDPASVTIHVGDTVKWTWAGGGHSVTSGNGCTPDNAFCSPSDSSCATGTTSPAGTTYSHTFTTAGTFPYFCVPHCSAGMKGTVVVQ